MKCGETFIKTKASIWTQLQQADVGCPAPPHLDEEDKMDEDDDEVDVQGEGGDVEQQVEGIQESGERCRRPGLARFLDSSHPVSPSPSPPLNPEGRPLSVPPSASYSCTFYSKAKI